MHVQQWQTSSALHGHQPSFVFLMYIYLPTTATRTHTHILHSYIPNSLTKALHILVIHSLANKLLVSFPVLLAVSLFPFLCSWLTTRLLPCMVGSSPYICGWLSAHTSLCGWLSTRLFPCVVGCPLVSFPVWLAVRLSPSLCG